MQVKEAIANRLSIRRYAHTPVPREHMDTLLKALQLAPSANNAQNWEFVFVADPKVKSRLVSACMNQKFVADCSYFIAAVADPSQKWHMVDITIALTQFTLQAVELGYGTCWIGAFNPLRVQEVLGVAEHKKVVICMTFGVPQSRHVPRGRKPIEDFIFRDRYSHPWE